ncbi:AAA family ATPase [Mycobacterium scrofulaceum]|uniref:AAA+ ATPase domain-containing protein n=1 Tax=Mycobacterium scrofulaceum TaxID=1783 RepID=A0A1A2W2H1_MYCSC|nr:AAA family ATPase [Mycobacterium scrofulaceum]OBI07067.1 hypothetical protein A5679_11535 [Mycobacterium scrofulaceum]
MSRNAIEIIVDALRANGRQVIDRGGDRYSAQCPAHDDQHPSLEIKPRNDCKGAVVTCFAGCDYRDVLAAIGLQPRHLYDDAGMRAIYHDRRTYTYPDGRQVHRKPGKRFHQSGNTHGRALFHAERIGEAALVYVCEGEKDVEAIEAVGGTAVSPPQGASTPPEKFDWSPLTGLSVVVVADRDADGQGRRHAEAVVNALNGTALRIDVAEAASGKDPADHIAAGLTLRELVPITLDGVNRRKPPHAPALNNAFVTASLAEVTPERVAWLWEGRVPAGKLVTLDGDPGLGKSTLALAFAAIVATGGQWPDGTRCEHPGDVVLLSAEDGVADTIRPRADAAGADPARIHVVRGVPVDDNGALRLPTLADVEQLRQVITDTSARLVIIDVLMAYLPVTTDSHKDQDIRSVLARLSALAEETGATILLLRHLNKGKGADPLYRGGGSIGIVGAARAGMLVAPDPEDPDVRVLAWTKSNLAPAPDSLNYRLVDAPEHGCARVVWGGVSAHTARTLLAEDDAEAGNQAKDFIVDYLGQRGGEAPAADVLKAGRSASFSEQELKDARRRGTPKIDTRKASFGDGWVWALRPKVAAPPSTAPDATFDVDGSLGATFDSSPKVAQNAEGGTEKEDRKPATFEDPVCACGEPLTTPASIRYGKCYECRLSASKQSDGNDDGHPDDLLDSQ